MAGIYGNDPVFDYRFTYENEFQSREKCKKELTNGSLASLIQEINPKWHSLLIKADLLWKLDDVQFNATVFLPQYESIPENLVLNSDKDTARSIVKYHMMMGVIPRNVLATSQGQKLMSTIKGQDIYAYWPNTTTLFLNNTSRVLEFDMFANNGVLHIIDAPLLNNLIYQ